VRSVVKEAARNRHRRYIAWPMCRRRSGSGLHTEPSACAANDQRCDVAQVEALLATTFTIGLDVGRGKDTVALVRLRLSKVCWDQPVRARTRRNTVVKSHNRPTPRRSGRGSRTPVVAPGEDQARRDGRGHTTPAPALGPGAAPHRVQQPRPVIVTGTSPSS
jgi:hypothetical protein